MIFCIALQSTVQLLPFLWSSVSWVNCQADSSYCIRVFQECRSHNSSCLNNFLFNFLLFQTENLWFPSNIVFATPLKFGTLLRYIEILRLSDLEMQEMIALHFAMLLSCSLTLDAPELVLSWSWAGPVQNHSRGLEGASEDPPCWNAQMQQHHVKYWGTDLWWAFSVWISDQQLWWLKAVGLPGTPPGTPL